MTTGEATPPSDAEAEADAGDGSNASSESEMTTTESEDSLTARTRLMALLAAARVGRIEFCRMGDLNITDFHDFCSF